MNVVWYRLRVSESQRHTPIKIPPPPPPGQRGPKFNTARHHFESYLAAWPLVRDIKMYNETSGQVTWALKNQSTYDSKWQRAVLNFGPLWRGISVGSDAL